MMNTISGTQLKFFKKMTLTNKKNDTENEDTGWRYFGSCYEKELLKVYQLYIRFNEHDNIDFTIKYALF